MLRAILSVIQRNSKLLIRKKGLMIQPIVVPIVMLLLSAIIFGGGGDAWPIGLVNHSDSKEAASLVESIKESHSNISPYFQLISTDEAEASKLVDQGRIQLLIDIPENYAQTKTINIETFNINSDAMKNARLRLEHAINNRLAETKSLEIDYTLQTEKEQDVWRSAYLGGSCVLLALFFGSIMLGANLYAFEYENRTRKEILLTPLGPVLAGIGNMLTAILFAFVTTIPTLLVAMLFFRLSFSGWNAMKVLLGMLPIMLACAGIGILLGRLFKKYRIIQPILVIVAIGTVVIGGGFVGVPLLPEFAQTFTDFWVFSRIFTWFNPLLHGFVDYLSWSQWIGIITAAILGVCLMIWSYTSETKHYMSGGQ
ncbi:hypothetical protein CD798_05130 [Bacillaceae bacterium SAOS 7]|nr:hypothetical protein CD798_05130 [Bacillaceae bacterium SAOS 7]